MMKSKILGLCVAGALAAIAANAPAQAAGVKIGTLICDVSGGIGLILGSSKSVACSFKNDNGRTEFYRGTISKFGLDIGVTKKSTLAWVVFAPGETRRGALAGTYVGGTAEATVGGGIGANALIGGFNDNIALQPLSVQAQTGLNVAAGVAKLTLRAD